MTKQQKTEKDEAIAKLREWLKPGDTVYTILEHVSRSGMQREIRVLIAKTDDNGQPYFIHPNHAVATALGYRQGKRDGLIVGGCGSDMGFEIVYSLGYRLWPDGVPCVGAKCQSNDHHNGDRDYTAGKTHRDSGYALKHQWL